MTRNMRQSMHDHLHTIDLTDLPSLTENTQQQAIGSLEAGKVVYLPTYFFSLSDNEQFLLSDAVLDPKHKNISYNYTKQHLSGLINVIQQSIMQELMHRFAKFSKQLIDALFPNYSQALRWGRTSYRPAEISGRKTSKRKDDTRLHVDSFSATPVDGLRILRVFCNINPDGKPRVWHLGESFNEVLTTFAAHIPHYSSTRAKLLKLIKATKTLRSPYDHYMLHLHDSMKLDDNYQQKISKHRVEFPPQSSWVVFTDQVSHAALSGQFLLEQTFYLPVSAMKNSSLSPLKQWEKEKSADLI